MAINVPPTRYALRMFIIGEGEQMPEIPSSADNYSFFIRATYLAVTPRSLTFFSDELLEPQSHLLSLGAESLQAIFPDTDCTISDGAIASFAPAVADFFRTVADDGRDYDTGITIHIAIFAASYGELSDIGSDLIGAGRSYDEWGYYTVVLFHMAIFAARHGELSGSTSSDLRALLAATEWDYVDRSGAGLPDPDDFDRAVSESVAMVRTVPASESSVEALEIVRIDDTGEKCTICFEGYGCSGGDDGPAVRMPCSHVYHKLCIVRWLKNSHLCPLCRYAMPTSSD